MHLPYTVSPGWPHTPLPAPLPGPAHRLTPTSPRLCPGGHTSPAAAVPGGGGGAGVKGALCPRGRRSTPSSPLWAPRSRSPARAFQGFGGGGEGGAQRAEVWAELGPVGKVVGVGGSWRAWGQVPAPSRAPSRTSRSSRKSRIPPHALRGLPLSRPLGPQPLCELRGPAPLTDGDMAQRGTAGSPGSHSASRPPPPETWSRKRQPGPPHGDHRLGSPSCCCPWGGRGGGEKVKVRLGSHQAPPRPQPAQPALQWAPTLRSRPPGSHPHGLDSACRSA